MSSSPNPEAGSIEVTVAIIEDEEDMRETVRSWLRDQPGIQCVGAWSSLGEAVERVFWIKPDVILLDLHLADGDSLKGITTIREIVPATKIVMMTGEGDYSWIEQCLNKGANGYLLKGSLPGIIPVAIREVLTGGTPLSGAVARKLVEQNLPETETVNDYEKLTDRERVVLGYMAEGLGYKEIAGRLELSIETVRTHSRNILIKLRAPNKTAAVVIYLQINRFASHPKPPK